MGDAIWYYAQNGNRKGPVSDDTIKALIDAGAIAASTQVWREGMSEWEPAFRHIAGVVPPAPGQAPGRAPGQAARMGAPAMASGPYGQGVSFTQAFGLFWSKYADFGSRSVRSEFWWWVVWGIIFSALTTSFDYMFVDMTMQFTPANWIWSLVTFIPMLALATRRLHDINRSGWWQLIALTGIGLILLIVWWAQASDTEPNRFG